MKEGGCKPAILYLGFLICLYSLYSLNDPSCMARPLSTTISVCLYCMSLVESGTQYRF